MEIKRVIMDLNLNTVLTWIAIIILTLIVVIRSLMNSSESASSVSAFDIKEMSWIPKEVLDTINKSVNDIIIPKLKSVSAESWDKLDRKTKDALLKELTDQAKRTADSINTLSLNFFLPPLPPPSPSPSPSPRPS